MTGVRLPLARASFWLAFLVVLAGSVVRMTGSGMGCPDWPKCFGLLVPPTEASQVTWTPGAHYDEGRMLVNNDTLWVAQSAFVARDFDVERARGQWQPYLKHDYATFNAAHTWIEFINRCLGALAGIPALLLLLAAAWSRDLRTTLLALLGVLALGFVAWLGKLVDGNLIPHSITIHMLGALAILCIDSVIIQRLRGLTVRWQRSARWGLAFALAVTLAQILTGTEVREVVDLLLKQGLADLTSRRPSPRATCCTSFTARATGWCWRRTRFGCGAWVPLAKSTSSVPATWSCCSLLASSPRACCLLSARSLHGPNRSTFSLASAYFSRRGACIGAQLPAEWPPPPPQIFPWAFKLLLSR